MIACAVADGEVVITEKFLATGDCTPANTLLKQKGLQLAASGSELS